MIKRPARALALGLVFLVVSAIYGSLSRDWGGTTLLAALGIAMGAMAYVLVSGSPSGDDGA